LADAKLRDLPPRERAYKVSDGGNGLFVVIAPSGSRSFRYDYRLGGRRETLTIGRHEPVARHAQRSHLAYGMDVTLEEAIHNRILGGRSASSSSMRSSRSRWVSCSISSKHVHPSRDGSAEPLSQATLNRTISGAVDRINQDRAPDQEPFLPVSVHDLRRTFSSRLNDALFSEALVEASLAHQKKDQVAAAYNHARLSGPRRALMQAWADMLDCWMRGETAREVIVRGKVKIDEAAHDAEDMNL
jgi:hypothetical protein